MRAPILAGVLAGVFAALLVAAAFVALALSGPTATPAPSMVAAPSVTPPVAAPTEPTSEPTPSVSFTTPAPSPLPTTSPGPSPSPSPGDPQVGLAVGDIAPPLRLAQLGGAEVDTEALRGQPLWVNFMATWCPPCREELPIMDRLQRDLGDRMTIIVVDVEEDADTVASFFNSLEVALPVA
nr:redoxin domain-containing protein [Chloroflexota bacterium]